MKSNMRLRAASNGCATSSESASGITIPARGALPFANDIDTWPSNGRHAIGEAIRGEVRLDEFCKPSPEGRRRLELREQTMPYDVNVIAISWRQGKYTVIGEAPNRLDWSAVTRDKVIRDVSEANSIYGDHVGILGRSQILEYADSQAGRLACEAYLKDHPEATFFMIHNYEWESGMSD
jgi:hypothetical protein